MGIRGFSKVFTPKEIKINALKDQTGIIDASVLLYQACLGISSINSLTDGDGNSTIHLKVIISRILNFQANGIKQKWVFDYHEKNYQPPDKALELAKRRKRRTAAAKEITKLKEKQSNDDLFSDTDSDDGTDKSENKETDKSNIQKSINQKEKVLFSMTDRIVNDCKFILNCFDIPWLTSPKGYEAEHIGAAMTNANIGDFVYSTDVDALMYGTNQLVRSIKVKKKKVLQLYDLHDVLKDNKIDQNDLRKIGAVMGCDHCTKTKGIGVKTILKKYKTVELTKEQKDAIDVFNRKVDVDKLKFENYKCEPVSNGKKINSLLDWLEGKNFNRKLIKKQIEKVYEGSDLE
jgi:hypothetical protein